MDGLQRTGLIIPTLLWTIKRSPDLSQPFRALILCVSRRPWVSSGFGLSPAPKANRFLVSTALRTGLGAIDWNAEGSPSDSLDVRESEAAEQRSQWVVDRLSSREDEFTLKEDIK